MHGVIEPSGQRLTAAVIHAMKTMLVVPLPMHAEAALVLCHAIPSAKNKGQSRHLCVLSMLCAVCGAAASQSKQHFLLAEFFVLDLMLTVLCHGCPGRLGSVCRQGCRHTACSQPAGFLEARWPSSHCADTVHSAYANRQPLLGLV